MPFGFNPDASCEGGDRIYFFIQQPIPAAALPRDTPPRKKERSRAAIAAQLPSLVSVRKKERDAALTC